MNLLLINGSPKRKNSDSLKLTYKFIEGMKSINENITVKEITVDELNIESCRGCFGCWWGPKPGNCVLSDDMKNVIDDIIKADLLIWSFPLYYYNVPGKLKTLIDRQLPMVSPRMLETSEFGAHPTRYDFSKQNHVLISTCGFYTAEGNYGSVTAMFDLMYGKGNYETIFSGEGAMFSNKQAKPAADAYLEKVFRAGKEYASGGISPETKEALKALVIPREMYEAGVNGN